MKIVLVSSEVAPYVKTGGLADVTGSLPRHIDRNEFELVMIMPLYRSINKADYHMSYMGTIDIPHRGSSLRSGLFSSLLPGTDISVFFIEQSIFFNRNGLYQDNNSSYDDNDERFAFFCRSVLEICRRLNFPPDVIHCNDWQTGLIPVYLKTLYGKESFFSRTSTLFTIHNLSFRGLFDPEKAISSSGLPWSVFSIHGAEFYGKFSFLKGGLYYSDLLNTVSARYSAEIQSEESGEGLHGLLQSRSDSLSGILNGVDYEVWNPSSDPLIKKNYDLSSIEYKKINTEFLCLKCGLEYEEKIPVIGMITRLTEQKGIDLVTGIIDVLMAKNLKLIILGTGDEFYHKLFTAYAEKYSGKMAAVLKYDEELSHLIYAGSDIFLMPSKFEPCGLAQLVSLKYGTIPVVRETGGLADTIKGFTMHEVPGKTEANGFVFREYSGSALYETLNFTLEIFNNKILWNMLVLNAMNCDFSWTKSAKEYESLYRRLCRMTK